MQKEVHYAVLCELENGWRFAMELDKNEYKAWEEAIEKAALTK